MNEMDSNQTLVSNFESDLLVLFGMPIRNQNIVFRNIDPKINLLFSQMESLSEEDFINYVMHATSIEKDNRNEAIRRSAQYKSDTNWMTASLLEYTYNSILSNDESIVSHVSKRLMKWMRDMEDLNL